MNLIMTKVQVTGIGCAQDDPSVGRCGRSPTLFEQARQLMNEQYNKQFEYIRDKLRSLILERATERKLVYDIKKAVGGQFRVELQQDVTDRVVKWLRDEGFSELKLVGDVLKEEASKTVNNRCWNVHNNPYKHCSNETVLLEW